MHISLKWPQWDHRITGGWSRADHVSDLQKDSAEIYAVRTVDEMTDDKEICSGKDGASDNINEMAMKTVACRCEEITLATIRKWIGEGYDTFDELKRLLRVGMGPCQGRGCRDIVLREISQITGKSISEIPIGTLRPPAKPIKIELSANQILEVTGNELEEYR